MKSIDLFLDSGAFSAWSKGVEINIDEYIKFIKEHEKYIDVYANLDVLGDPQKTWENQKYMESNGLHPLPCFHYNEPEKWLKRYLNAGHEYIALGGMVPISSAQLVYWLDHLFSDLLTDDNGTPLVKVHGFGMTSLPLMLRYPWFSVDSTSWVMTGRMGSVFVPRWKGNKLVYDENPWKVCVSNRNAGSKEAGENIENFTPLNKQIIIDYIEGKGFKLGKSKFKKVESSYVPKESERWAEKKTTTDARLLEIVEEEGLSNTYQLRDEINIMYFLDLEKSMPAWPWSFKKKEKGFGL